MQGVRLTERQKRFCRYYAKCGNGTRAAILAGYNEESAKQIACENLTKPYLQIEIDKEREKLLKKLDLDKDYVIAKWKQILEMDCSEFIEIEKGKVIFETLENVPKEIRKLIKGIKQTKVGVEVTFMDKDKALDNVAAALGMNKQKVELPDKIQIEIVKASDENKSSV